jgi:hypothetical protein
MTTFFSALGPLNSLLLVSGAASAIVLIYLAVRTRRPRVMILTLLVVSLSTWIVYSVSPAMTGTRSTDNGNATLIISYVAMVLGMTGHYVYVQAERGAKRLQFNWLSFVMPILASPIVFIPLVSLAGEVPAVGGAFTHAKVMVYLVAFQNGFFWRHFFDQQKPESAAPPRRARSTPPAAQPAGGSA